MFERSELALKIFCGALALMVVYRLVLVIAHINPLYHLAIPALPTLASVTATNSSSGPNNSHPSNQPATNHVLHSVTGTSTNADGGTTNIAARSRAHDTAGSNVVAHSTNLPGQATNLFAQSTNVTGHTTNTLAQTTNASPNTLGSKAGPMARPPQFGRRGTPGGGMPGMPTPGLELPPEIQARIDRVIDSEIIAPIMHPLPMALLGIAGKDAFLRAPNGQTGLIKEGDELGGVKLVRIGVNRVLVEEQGERKELTIFAGLGSESLLSTQKDTPK